STSDSGIPVTVGGGSQGEYSGSGWTTDPAGGVGGPFAASAVTRAGTGIGSGTGAANGAGIGAGRTIDAVRGDPYRARPVRPTAAASVRNGAARSGSLSGRYRVSAVAARPSATTAPVASTRSSHRDP